MVNPFSKNGFRYYPDPVTGKELVSVTTLLDVIGSKALFFWAQKQGTKKVFEFEKAVREIDENVANKAKDIFSPEFWASGSELAKEAASDGQMAHAWFEAYLRGVEPSLDALSPNARKSVEGFLAWRKHVKLEVIELEKTYFNRIAGYAGTCDIVAKVDGELCLGDWKTSSAIYDKFPVQVWAYAWAAETEDPNLLFKKVFVGRFGKDGTWEVKFFERNGFPGYELSRRLIQACIPWFNYLRQWEKVFSYKPKEKKNAIPNATP